ncbi:MAG TPA: response regulator transcription factor [Anaerolineae bacterium]|nr:response regulator transcription factor [Anaerolineae bacterium]
MARALPLLCRLRRGDRVKRRGGGRSMPTKILLIDDHTVLREGLKALLNSEPGLEVVGDAADGRAGILAADKLKPDLVIVDISMPGLNGIESVRILRRSYPYMKLIILSMHSGREYVAKALQAGANGYVLKQGDTNEVISAIRLVMDGGAYFSPAISRHLVNDFLGHTPIVEEGPRLTTREREVAQLIAEGQSTREISQTLTVSIKTVETHRANIMRKLKTKSQADVIKYALKKGWVSLE